MICVLMQHPSILYFCSAYGYNTPEECMIACPVTTKFQGLTLVVGESKCYYDDGELPSPTPFGFDANNLYSGSGPVGSVEEMSGLDCYKYFP